MQLLRTLHQLCLLPETALDNIYTMEIKKCYKSGLFLHGEPVYQHTTGSNHTEFRTGKQKDDTAEERVRNVKSMRESSIYYLIGVSKEAKTLKNDRMIEETFDEIMAKVFPELMIITKS